MQSTGFESEDPMTQVRRKSIVFMTDTQDGDDVTLTVVRISLTAVRETVQS